MIGLHHKTEIFIYAIFTVIACVYLYISPPTTAPDEIAHLAYPRHIIIDGELPSFTNPQDTWESHQPPLYYLVSIPFVTMLQTLPIHLQLVLDRIPSIIFLICSFFLLYRSANNFFPDNRLQRILYAICAGLPLILYAAGSFSNDITLYFAGSLLMYLISRRHTYTTDARAILLGICIGLIALTKFHAFPFLVIGSLYILYNKQIRIWVISVSSALCISGWWFVHNLRNVGDILGIQYTFQLWSGQQTEHYTLSTLATFVSKLFASTVGVFGKLNIFFHPAVYVIAAALVLICILFWLQRNKNNEEKIFALACLATIGLLLYQSFSFFQPQGRYLLAIIPGVAFLLTQIFSQRSERFMRNIVMTFFMGIIVLHVYSFWIIHDYYQNHPIETFTKDRSVEILQYKFIGMPDYKPSDATPLVVTSPKTFYTLADFRFPSTPQPFITITLRDPQDGQGRIYWKVLGMHSFADDRSVPFSLNVASQTIPINELSVTLIQDLQFSFSKVDTATEIQSITLHY